MTRLLQLSLVLIAVLQLSFCKLTSAQNLQLVWKYELGGEIIAAPVVLDDKVYIGSQNGIFCALDVDGKELWRFETDGSIQASALIVDGKIFFESGNIFYLLTVASGKLIWQYDPQLEEEKYSHEGEQHRFKLDPFDDIRSKATYANGIIYIGGVDGTVFGLSIVDGRPVVKIASDDPAPIRSSPLIEENRLYYGDWAGVMYCNDVEEGSFLWSRKMFDFPQPYPTFGGIVSSFWIHDDLLFFGARNYTLNGVNKVTGELIWSYTDPEEGWIVGDPIVHNDTLYIGGSDNFSLFSIEPNSGHIFWQAAGTKNIITKPLIIEEYIVYTEGNWYQPSDKGAVVLADRSNGKQLNRYYTKKAVFSSPASIGSGVVVGCHDGFIYNLSIDKL
ncbi:MAG: PQQ-binding-like beta-propeller repeat protein [Cyclobacteriaceae bacterium]